MFFLSIFVAAFHFGLFLGINQIGEEQGKWQGKRTPGQEQRSWSGKREKVRGNVFWICYLSWKVISKACFIPGEEIDHARETSDLGRGISVQDLETSDRDPGIEKETQETEKDPAPEIENGRIQGTKRDLTQKNAVVHSLGRKRDLIQRSEKINDEAGNYVIFS